MMGRGGKMLDFVTIEKIAAKAAAHRVASPGLERVVAQPTTDSEGREALRMPSSAKIHSASRISAVHAVERISSKYTGVRDSLRRLV
jgi:hypothetical protein